jgi:uncharacterized protein
MKFVTLFLTLSLLTYKLAAAAFSESGHAPWGMDCGLACISHKSSDNLHTLAINEKPKLTPGQKSCRAMIRFFQIYISPIDGPRSSFYPTSSQYTLEAIQKYGVFRGIAMGCDRLMRENAEMWVYATTRKYGVERKLDPVR